MQYKQQFPFEVQNIQLISVVPKEEAGREHQLTQQSCLPTAMGCYHPAAPHHREMEIKLKEVAISVAMASVGDHFFIVSLIRYITVSDP